MLGYLYHLQKVSILFSRYRGLRILSELIRRAFVHTNNSLITNRFDGDLKFQCDLNEHIGSQIFWRGSYSSDSLRILNQLLSREKTFIDVGANQGEFTLFAAKRLQKGRVIAFEPTSYMYERLAQNVALNGFRNVDLVKKALSDKPGQLPIYAPMGKFHDATVNAGLPSLYKTGASSDYLETIDVTTLDAYVRLARPARIDVIKVDIEGAELSMLHGAAETIGSFRPILIIEVSRVTCRAAGYDSGEILKYIESQGYRMERILSGGRTQPIGSAILTDYQNVVCYPT